MGSQRVRHDWATKHTGGDWETPEVRGGSQEVAIPTSEVRGGSPKEQPNIQGAVAAQAQEGREEPLHVQGQEGWQWGDIPRPRPSSVSNMQWCQAQGGEVVTTSSVVHSISHFTKQIGILNQKIPLHINPNYFKSYMKRQNFCSLLSMRIMSPLYNPGKF